MKTNSVLFLAFIAVSVFGVSVRADTNKALASLAGLKSSGESWETTVSFTAMERYYGTIVGGIFYAGGAMSFTSIENVREDMFGSVSINLSIGRKLDSVTHDPRDGGDEYGLNLNRRLSLGYGKFKCDVDFGVFYQALGHISQSRDDVLQTNIGLAMPEMPIVQPYVRIFQFDRTGNSSIDPGWFAYAGFTRDQRTGVRFRERDIILGFDFRTGYGGGVFGTDKGAAYHRLGISVPFDLSEGWKIIPSIVGQTPAGGQRPGRAFVDKNRTFAVITVSKHL